MTGLGLFDGHDYATGRGQVDALERYYTPVALAQWLVDSLHWEGIGTVLEPHAGGGAFLRALQKRFSNMHQEVGYDGMPLEPPLLRALDADPNCASVQQGLAACGDFLTADLEPVDLIIGNPPFSKAEAHVERALDLAGEVVFLLPISRLETPSRGAFYDGTRLKSVTLLAERVWPGSRQIGVFCFYGSRNNRRPVHRTLNFASWR